MSCIHYSFQNFTFICYSCVYCNYLIFLTGRDRGLDSRRSLSPSDFEDSRTKEVLSAEIHCYEFFRLVIDLLRSLCGTELNGITAISAYGGQHYTLQIVNFALENLCTLQFGGNSNLNLIPSQVIDLKAAMTRLLLTALEKVCKSNLVKIIYLSWITAKTK